MNLHPVRLLSWIAGIVFLSATASAAVKTEVIEYRDGDTVLEGYLAYDPAAGVRPGVLVVHQWMGLGDYEKKRCEMLAELGYTAFAVDIYGKGVRPGTPGDAGKLAGQYKGDRALFRRRLAAGLARFRQVTSADASKTAAIGYCFGGTGVLELARSGADLRGVVSFHGGLSSPTPADASQIKARVLACHGADDPFVPAEEVAGFEKEMREANVDWQLIAYGGAVHSFTDWRATGAMKGAQYNEKADKRSWAAMQTFLGDVFR
jgi:dienelactone hydrolase